MNKKQIRVFGHNYYLLGTYKDGKKYYIQEPTWDCDWYWGGIYINSFTNNNQPERSKDIDLHTHFDYMFFKYKGKTSWEILEQDFTDLVLDHDEIWKVLELCKSFYILKEAAGFYHCGGANFTGSMVNELELKSNEMYKTIVKVQIPTILNKLKEILTGVKPEVDYFSKQIITLK